MKLTPNPFDKPVSRLIQSQALLILYNEDKNFDFEFVEKTYKGLMEQVREISTKTQELDLDLEDMTTVAVRVKELLDKYLIPLGKLVSKPDQFRASRVFAAHFVSHAEVEIKMLNFTLDCAKAS